MKQKWQSREDATLRRMYADRPTKDAAKALGRSLSSVYQRARILGLGKSEKYLASEAARRFSGNEGVRFRFKHGLTPWNAGKKGWQAGGRSTQTQFKKGQILGAAAQKRRPIGSTSVVDVGAVLVKVSETGNRRRDWQYTHVVAWEAVNGPVPKGRIITRDLRCLSRAELMGRNTFHRYPADLKFAMRLTRKLERKIRNAEEQNARSPRPSICNA